MFGFLKKHLKKAAEELAKKVTGKGAEKTAEKGELKTRPARTIEKEDIRIEDEKAERLEKKPAEGPEKKIEPSAIEKKDKGLVDRLIRGVTEKRLTEEDIENFFLEYEPELLQDNVAVEAADAMKSSLKHQLAGREISRLRVNELIYDAFYNAILETVDNGTIDLEEIVRKAKGEGRPAVILFLGFNGSGKTTSIAKAANYLENKGHKVVLAAADTFRAAAIDQLEKHASNLKIRIIKTQYGHDPAAVVFDAVQFAKAKGHDIVLADTAGRTHINKNLIDELAKVIRVNKPDLKILVVDSLTGNDAVEQAKTFDKAIGIDGCILTKVDVNEKGGAILSVSYAVKKPILFLGTGQRYDDLQLFEPEKFVKGLLE